MESKYEINKELLHNARLAAVDIHGMMFAETVGPPGGKTLWDTLFDLSCDFTAVLTLADMYNRSFSSASPEKLKQSELEAIVHALTALMRRHTELCHELFHNNKITSAVDFMDIMPFEDRSAACHLLFYIQSEFKTTRAQETALMKCLVEDSLMNKNGIRDNIVVAVELSDLSPHRRISEMIATKVFNTKEESVLGRLGAIMLKTYEKITTLEKENKDGQ